MISCSLSAGTQAPKGDKDRSRIHHLGLKAGCPSLRPCLARTLTLTWRLLALPHPRPWMADTQQFFTGKLYVPVHILKLPAEELLWSALPRMTREEEADGGWEDWGRWCFTSSVFKTNLLDLNHYVYTLVINKFNIRILCFTVCTSFLSHKPLLKFCLHPSNKEPGFSPTLFFSWWTRNKKHHLDNEASTSVKML